MVNIIVSEPQCNCSAGHSAVYISFHMIRFTERYLWDTPLPRIPNNNVADINNDYVNLTSRSLPARGTYVCGLCRDEGVWDMAPLRCTQP